MSAYKHYEVELPRIKTLIACFKTLNKLELANFDIQAASYAELTERFELPSTIVHLNFNNCKILPASFSPYLKSLQGPDSKMAILKIKKS